MAEIWGGEHVDFRLRCVVNYHRDRSMVSRCRCMVGWSRGVVGRCRCRGVVRGGRPVRRGRFVRGSTVAVAWLLLGLLLPGGPGEADEVEEASEGRGHSINHIAKEGSCLQRKLLVE